MKLSVIIPFYNLERYVRECLDSVAAANRLVDILSLNCRKKCFRIRSRYVRHVCGSRPYLLARNARIVRFVPDRKSCRGDVKHEALSMKEFVVSFLKKEENCRYYSFQNNVLENNL